MQSQEYAKFLYRRFGERLHWCQQHVCVRFCTPSLWESDTFPKAVIGPHKSKQLSDFWKSFSLRKRVRVQKYFINTKKLLEIEKEVVREVAHRIMNTSWENLQIAKHKSVRCSFCTWVTCIEWHQRTSFTAPGWRYQVFSKPLPRLCRGSVLMVWSSCKGTNFRREFNCIAFA